MQYLDLHTHTEFSFDSEEKPERSCLAAIEKGISVIAITNHCDYDGIGAGIYPSYDFAAKKAATMAVKDRFADRLRVLYGIELGQPYLYREKWDEIRRNCAPEYVLGSVHNLAGVPDFAFLRFDEMSIGHCAHLFGRYLDEMEQILTVPGITTLSHMTYPIRYMRKCGKELDLRPFYPKIRQILCGVIDRGLFLEVNTSGLRQGVGETLPGNEILEIYRSLGGKKIAVGSDAHRAQDVGTDVIEVTDRLRGMGFTIGL